MPKTFVEKPLTGNEPTRCVDGRPSPSSEQGPQMLGGSLHPIVLWAIFNNANINETTIADILRKLQGLGIKTGAHRGSHQHDDTSDCGAADRLKDILSAAVQRKEIISERLMHLYESSSGKLEIPNLLPFNQQVIQAFEKIASYSPDKVELTGESLVSEIEKNSSTIETVEGDHAEEVVFVNLKQNTTLDTISLNRQGTQAFNLDLQAAVSQAKQLGVSEEFAICASLILYTATEIVLVEDNGKPALSIEVHGQS